MHRLFQYFIDNLTDSVDEVDLRRAIATAAEELDLQCFAYLLLGDRSGLPKLISNYPAAWTDHYLKQRYERLDPVITQVLKVREPFRWGADDGDLVPTSVHRAFFAEASLFGIRYGYTIPIHDGRGPIAAVTFASDEKSASFRRTVEANGRILQLMAMYFHAHARKKLDGDRFVDGIRLSPREFECLEWAAQGKSAWEIGQILGVTRRTAAFHLDNARAKLSVHSIVQAVAKLAASRPNFP